MALAWPRGQTYQSGAQWRADPKDLSPKQRVRIRLQPEAFKSGGSPATATSTGLACGRQGTYASVERVEATRGPVNRYVKTRVANRLWGKMLSILDKSWPLSSRGLNGNLVEMYEANRGLTKLRLSNAD